MRLKLQLVLAITLLVFLIAGVLSLLYVHQLVKAAVGATYDTNLMVARQVRLALENALETGLKGRVVDPNNPGELQALVAQALKGDSTLRTTLDAVDRYSLTVYDVNIGDSQGMTLLSTNPSNEGKPLPTRANYAELLNATPYHMLAKVFGKPEVFDIVAPIENNGKLFATVNIGVRNSLLRAVYEPLLKKAMLLMSFALAAALAAAVLLSNLAFGPLIKISRQLDRLAAAGESQPESKPKGTQDVAEMVSTKIEKIGQRMKSVEEVYSALRENLDQILGNLQDGVLLFTEDKRAVLVSEAARRFLEIGGNILGKQAQEIFEGASVLSRTLGEAIASGTNLDKEEILTETGRRIQASVDFIYDSETLRNLGALITLHDLESEAEIESELELSRRMAAIGRLTSGVGHEVKNPINAIVVHLELLKAKLGDNSDGAAKHLEIIDTEIRRLDRVVQTLVNFSRPVDLDLREQDLRQIVSDVLALSAGDLSQRRVQLASRLPNEPLMAKVDVDLLKQAALNVILNGAQAMPEGGRLDVILEEENGAGDRSGAAHGKPAPNFAILRIADEGPGIPAEIREKIFNLYFTTKSGGSGIGLAMTYRILQLHHGSVDVESKKGHGAVFRLRIPLVAAERGHRRILAATASS
jgi:signal transduction histidine kinase